MSKKVVAMLLVVACKGGSKSDPPPPVATETHELAGIHFVAPRGSQYAKSSQDGPDTPAEEVSGQGYKVTVVRQQYKFSLKNYKETIESGSEASNVTGTETAHGWVVKYHSSVAYTSAGRTIYMHYVTIGEDEHYQCSFDDEDSPDVKTAEAICRSIEKK